MPLVVLLKPHYGEMQRMGPRYVMPAGSAIENTAYDVKAAGISRRKKKKMGCVVLIVVDFYIKIFYNCF